MGMTTNLDTYATYLTMHGHPAETIEQYTSYPRRLIVHAGVEDISQITIDHVAEFFTTHNYWAANTRRRATGSLRLFFDWAIIHGDVQSNPLRLMKPVKGPRGVPRPIPEGDLLEALERCTAEQRRLLILAAETGLRRSELAAIHRDDVELHEQYWLRVHGKGRKVRLVPISEALAVWIMSKREWLFPSPIRNGEHVIPSVVGKRVHRALGKAQWTTHTLRHRFATIAYRHSSDIMAVQALLGHESVATTQIYIQVANERLRGVASGAALAGVDDEELADAITQLPHVA